MDDTFRLVFVWPGETPTAASYAASDALVYGVLRDAIKFGHEQAIIDGKIPYIAYKYVVLEPFVVDLLYQEFVTATVAA